MVLSQKGTVTIQGLSEKSNHQFSEVKTLFSQGPLKKEDPIDLGTIIFLPSNDSQNLPEH